MKTLLGQALMKNNRKRNFQVAEIAEKAAIDAM